MNIELWNCFFCCKVLDDIFFLCFACFPVFLFTFCHQRHLHSISEASQVEKKRAHFFVEWLLWRYFSDIRINKNEGVCKRIHKFRTNHSKNEAEARNRC